jgi:beta-lactamase regulating signal transducer with metallopeptidase domain
MTSSFFSLFVSFQVVAAAAVAGLVLASSVFRKLSSSARLRLHYGGLVMVFAAPLSLLFRPAPRLFEPVVKVWSAPLRHAGGAAAPVHAQSFVRVGEAVSINADHLFLFVLGVCAGSILLAAAYLLRGQWQVRRVLRRAFVFKSIGRVRVLICDECKIPFSYRGWKFAYAVLPSYLVNDPRSLRLALAHEIQHHRQGDTISVYPRLLLSALGALNPFVHFWNRWIDEVQEFACDEILVGRQNLQAREYARCLIQVAETAWVREKVPAGATGMILLNRGQLLNRRIQTMFQEPQFHGRWAWAVPLALVGAMIGVTAYAAKGLVQDRRVTMAQAQELLKNAKSEWPVRLNQDVLYWLNQYAGTIEGRAQSRETLRRMETYRGMIDAKIKAYRVPAELAAIPFTESGYRNLPESGRRGVGAGLWMFIAATARHFGMHVDETLDERLNEEKETEAAMRYLLANKLLFDDWELSILAYNAGEGKVREERERLGVDDAWELVEKGRFARETRDYLPKLNAAILIINNPSLLD